MRFGFIAAGVLPIASATAFEAVTGPVPAVIVGAIRRSDARLGRRRPFGR